MPGNWPAWFGPGVAGNVGDACTSRHLAGGLPVCRLRLNGLIRRIEHTQTYVLTPDGQRIAIFYTKLRQLAAPTSRKHRPRYARH